MWKVHVEYLKDNESVQLCACEALLSDSIIRVINILKFYKPYF